jgi:hypothetical protein
MVEEHARNDMVFRVLNPTGIEQEVAPISLAPRVADLSGKVIYCISQYIGGSDVFLQKIAEALPRHVGNIKTVYKRKPANYQVDDPELWAEIEREADAVIYGCGA